MNIHDVRDRQNVERSKVKVTGVEQAEGQGGRMPLQISMQGGENRSLPSHFLMASLPMV